MKSSRVAWWFVGPALLVIAVWLWTYLARDRIAAAMEAHDAGSVA